MSRAEKLEAQARRLAKVSATTHYCPVSHERRHRRNNALDEGCGASEEDRVKFRVMAYMMGGRETAHGTFEVLEKPLADPLSPDEKRKRIKAELRAFTDHLIGELVDGIEL